MSDQQEAAQQSNGGAERHVSAEELKIKAEHRQEIVRIENETATELARLDAERTRRMPVALRMFFDDRLYERSAIIAKRMASAQGFTPQHLIGQEGACFAVVSKALAWNLDPFSVAQSTYQVGGRVAYEGRLVQAVMEASGRLRGGIRARYIGNWSKVEGKFRLDGNKPVRAWSDADEEGLGIVLTAHLHGEDEPREFEFFLKQCHPRNASTWPTRPKQQLHYNAIRAFASVAAPSLLLGVPFQDDFDAGEPPMKDITPKAPPPVDLAAEGIKGGGAMREVEPSQKQTTETIDPETGEVTEAAKEPGPRRQRRSYRQITDDVIAMLADAETENDVDMIMAEELTPGVRGNAELIGEISAAEREARQRISETTADRPEPAQETARSATAGQQTGFFPTE